MEKFDTAVVIQEYNTTHTDGIDFILNLVTLRDDVNIFFTGSGVKYLQDNIKKLNLLELYNLTTIFIDSESVVQYNLSLKHISFQVNIISFSEMFAKISNIEKVFRF